MRGTALSHSEAKEKWEDHVAVEGGTTSSRPVSSLYDGRNITIGGGVAKRRTKFHGTPSTT